MKSVKVAFGILLAVAVSIVLFCGEQEAAQSSRKENHCFICHTSSQQLIKITREIAAANKGKKTASSESEGEG